MAQLNPNFEIDFNDINSYEQIQLINDTRLAKENLLMHRAYKEPSDDEIIRNHFSSFTFVDFCPKLFSASSASLKRASVSSPSSYSLSSGVAHPLPAAPSGGSKVYELETFSDLFERINSWLKLNKDWRVVSMVTLVYDCTSLFNHVKSSIHSSQLPQNTRGLRLFLSPSKSRFSGPQKIGCINVVPRKVSGSYSRPREDPVVYETLDEILDRLNDLLLTRPIEGRILSVETITLPIVDGYVNTETNYLMDNRLNALYESTYSPASPLEPQGQPASPSSIRQHHLIDVLRVYYEFGPMVCGLVNLIDFVPRFYTACPSVETPSQSDSPQQSRQSPQAAGEAADRSQVMSSPPKMVEKIAATETLTRLIRRSLTWFESQRKHILEQDWDQQQQPVASSSAAKQPPTAAHMNLKLCNLQVFQKTLLKSQLVKIRPSNAVETVGTRLMAHERMNLRAPIVCSQCCLSTATSPLQDWCSHLRELSQPYQVKFVRLAYVVPVYHKYTRPPRPLRSSQSRLPSTGSLSRDDGDDSTSTSSSSSSSSDGDQDDDDDDDDESSTPDPQVAPTDEIQTHVMDQLIEGEEWAKQAALRVVKSVSEQHRQEEQLNQVHEGEDRLNDLPIGHLTYRLFAPCQLVNSSSCFSINPVNSSSPLARRGSVDLNGSGLSSENAHPSSSLLGISQPSEMQQVVTSFGAFFPALSHEIMAGTESIRESAGRQQAAGAAGGTNRFTTNEFELVDAIKRRMEIYVTTNSMKVLAGETLIVNLSDALSCLSTAIEQTIVKCPFGPQGQRPASTWVSVQVLYAAVDEPQLPVQLLAQQKLRDLSLIKEQDEQQLAEHAFDDDFKGTLDLAGKSPPKDSNAASSEQQVAKEAFGEAAGSSPSSSIQVEEKESSIMLYNSAYDRTVPLPSQPTTSSCSLDPAEFLGSQVDCLWLDEQVEAQQLSQLQTILLQGEAGTGKSKKGRKQQRNKKRRAEDSQCSIM